MANESSDQYFQKHSFFNAFEANSALGDYYRSTLHDYSDCKHASSLISRKCDPHSSHKHFLTPPSAMQRPARSLGGTERKTHTHGNNEGKERLRRQQSKNGRQIRMITRRQELCFRTLNGLCSNVALLPYSVSSQCRCRRSQRNQRRRWRLP